jgi:hypothetical protein
MNHASPHYSTVRVAERPDRLEPRTLYVVGEGKDRFCAAMVCPCGCGADLYMSLVVGDEPSWRAKTHRDGATSLFPSVARKTGCRSHFVLRRGRVTWCAWESPSVPRRRRMWKRIRAALLR